MKHEIREQRGNDGDCGEMSWIQPVCTCGWEGTKVYAWNNWQFTEVNRQGSEHQFELRQKVGETNAT